MRSPINSLVAVIPVKDFYKASAWYATLLGREADLIPVEEVAEWQLAEGAWLQVSIDPERAGSTTVVIGVDNIEQQCQLCNDAGITLGDIQEYPSVIKMAEICDLEGNKVSFVEDISESN